MSLTICYLFLLHFVADFLLQSREMGKTKSEKFNVLLAHVGIQFGIFLALGGAVLDGSTIFWFAAFNAIIHGVIDWNIWKFYKWTVFRRHQAVFSSPTEEGHEERVNNFKASWQYWEDHWFYATIGLDQFLHASTIIILYGMFG